MAKLSESSPPVPEFVAHLVELFEARAADLRFPGVDAVRLRNAVQQTEEQSSKIVELKAALQDALEGLAREQQNLLHLARQAHAYLSVFAQGEPEILDQLKAIPFGDAEKTPRRGRQRPAEMTPAPGVVDEEGPLLSSPTGSTAPSGASKASAETPSAAAKLAMGAAAKWVADAAPDAESVDEDDTVDELGDEEEEEAAE